MVVRTRGISAVVVQRTALPITCFSSPFLSPREHCHYWLSFKYAGERAALQTTVWHVKSTAVQLQPNRFWSLAPSPGPLNFCSSARAGTFFLVTWKGKDVALINTPSLMLQGTGGLAGGKQDGSWCSWLQDQSHITHGSCACHGGWRSSGCFEGMHLPAHGNGGVWVLREER